ncbi:MAG: sulfatase-like hydrolase/transferase [Candidatus Cyclobacteriaceae bacterium M3_2C_046]
MKLNNLNTHKNLIALMIIMVLAMSCQISGKADESLSPPNILVLTIEDISPYAFSMYGNDLVHMPALDRLAEEGITFDNASSNAPYCSPARYFGWAQNR